MKFDKYTNIIRMIESRGTGKTNRLLLLAKTDNATILTHCPDVLKSKAEKLGWTDLKIESYDYLPQENEKFLIDELELYIHKKLKGNFYGYSIGIEPNNFDAILMKSAIEKIS